LVLSCADRHDAQLPRRGYLGWPAVTSTLTPAEEFVHYRSLVWNFAQRDLKSRFKGTAGGWAWSFIVPLASLGVYFLVSKVILRASAPPFGNGKSGVFIVYLFVALTVWTFWANGLMTSIGSLIGTGVLLKKIYFPSYAPVLGAMIAVGIQSLIEIGVVMVVLLCFGNLGLSWLLAPVLCGLFFLFVTGTSLFLATCNIYFRDLQHFIGIFLQLLFYATPIIYTVSALDGHDFFGIPLRAIIMANPLSEFVQLFRDTLYSLEFGPILLWLGVLGWTTAAVLAGYFIYQRAGRDLAEQL
jgi:ABC-type polysaccharide/polyol phosphate export permease